MKRLSAVLLSAAALASPAFAAEPVTGCDPSAYQPDEFKVAIDRPSGVAFVHSPCGWTYMGIVKRESIDEGIALAKAEPVPPAVLRAELALRPWLANYLAHAVAASAKSPVRRVE